MTTIYLDNLLSTTHWGRLCLEMVEFECPGEAVTCGRFEVGMARPTEQQAISTHKENKP